MPKNWADSDHLSINSIAGNDSTSPKVLFSDSLLEEVIVTAQIRPSSSQDRPVSLLTLDGERLYQSGITSLESLTPHVPNFSMNQTGISIIITIRGISSGINQGFEQSVDGLNYGRAQLSRAPLFDIQRGGAAWSAEYSLW